MVAPPKTDPQRPIDLAANAARTLGVLFCIISLGVLALFFSFGWSSSRRGDVLLAIAAPTFLLILPAVLLFVFASRLKARRTSAAICLMVLGGLSAVPAAWGFFATLLDSGISPTLVAAGTILGAAVMLIVYSAQSLAAIRILTTLQGSHGFQPVMPWPKPATPVLPLNPAKPAPDELDAEPNPDKLIHPT